MAPRASVCSGATLAHTGATLGHSGATLPVFKIQFCHLNAIESGAIYLTSVFLSIKWDYYKS